MLLNLDPNGINIRRNPAATTGDDAGQVVAQNQAVVPGTEHQAVLGVEHAVPGVEHHAVLGVEHHVVIGA